MPRHPALAATLDSMRSDLFSSLAHRLANLSGDTFPLHIGDTYLEPAAGARMEDLTVAENPGMHRYTRPHGHPELIQRLSKQRGVPSDRILATAGATGGLCALADTTLDPGDEVLVLAPFWPLIRGIVQAAGGIPRQVPFYDRPGDVPDRLETHLTDRTVALYVNSPNNPTGRTLSEAEVAALAAFARSHDLWIWSDEVYEQFAYTGPHRPIAPAAPERTFTAFSFSKAWGMAGNRVGYLVGPTDPSALAQVRRIGTHTWYSASTAAQLAAARVTR